MEVLLRDIAHLRAISSAAAWGGLQTRFIGFTIPEGNFELGQRTLVR